MLPISIRRTLERALDAYGGDDGESASRWLAGIPIEGLSPAEIEVVRLIAQGYSSQEAADVLVLSERTIRSHVSNIFAKLAMHNRVQLTLWAVEHGVIVVALLNEAEEQEP